uniref:Uncharacterized protein n=1 Tax=Hanusia phi TaxID=3032 RepID=A0A7S0E135_9CRYP|mmetsp:Transcript_13824/g.31895  ORF Transcript_13824/g.31895 Transcript_13824/m.31895 type:complete len:1431 (+) Transcript_13824:90-4382(+)
MAERSRPGKGKTGDSSLVQSLHTLDLGFNELSNYVHYSKNKHKVVLNIPQSVEIDDLVQHLDDVCSEILHDWSSIQKGKSELLNTFNENVATVMRVLVNITFLFDSDNFPAHERLPRYFVNNEGLNQRIVQLCISWVVELESKDYKENDVCAIFTNMVTVLHNYVSHEFKQHKKPFCSHFLVNPKLSDFISASIDAVTGKLGSDGTIRNRLQQLCVEFWNAIVNWNIVDDQRFNKLRNVFINHPKMKELTEFLSKRIERRDEESIYFLTLLFESSEYLTLFLKEYDDVRRKCMDAIFNSLNILLTKLDLAKNPHVMLMENLVSIAGNREGRSFLLKDYSRQLLELLAQFISKFDKLYDRYKALTEEKPEEESELQGLNKLLGHFFRFYGSCHDERCQLVQAILDHFNSSRGVAKVLAHIKVFSNFPKVQRNESVELIDVEHYMKFLAAIKQRGGVAEEAKQSSNAATDALNRSKSSSGNVKLKTEESPQNVKIAVAPSARSQEEANAAPSNTASNAQHVDKEKSKEKHRMNTDSAAAAPEEPSTVTVDKENQSEAERSSLIRDEENAKESKQLQEPDDTVKPSPTNGANVDMDVEKRKERAGLLLASMVASQDLDANPSGSKAGPSAVDEKESAEAMREKKSAEALLGLFDAVPITQGNVMSEIVSASSKKRKESNSKDNSLERIAKRLNSQKENMQLEDSNMVQNTSSVDSQDLLLSSSKEAQIIRTLFSPKEKAKKKDAVWRAYVSNNWEDDEFLFEPLSSPEFIDPAEYESDENSNDIRAQCNIYLKNSQNTKSLDTEERKSREPMTFEINTSWARNPDLQRSGKSDMKSSMAGISTAYPSLSGDMLHQLAKKMRPDSPSSSRGEMGGLKSSSDSNFSRSQKTAAEALCSDVSREVLRKKVANYIPVQQSKAGQERGESQLPFGGSVSMAKSGGSPKGSGIGDRSSIPSLIDSVGENSWQDKVAQVASFNSIASRAAVSSASYLLSKGKSGNAAEILSRQTSRQIQDLMKDSRASSQEASRSDAKSSNQYAGLVGSQGIPASQLASAYQQIQLQQAASQSKNILQLSKAATAFPVQSTGSLFTIPYIQHNATQSLFAAAAATSASHTKKRNSMKHVEIANMIHTYSKTVQQFQNRQYLACMQVPTLNLGARTGLTLGAFPNPSFLTAHNLFAKIGHLSNAAASLQVLQQAQAKSQQQQSKQQAQQKLSQQNTSQPPAQTQQQQQQQQQSQQQSSQQHQASQQQQQQLQHQKQKQDSPQQPQQQQPQQQQGSSSQPSGSSASPPAGGQQGSSQATHESTSQQLPSQTGTGPKNPLGSVGGQQSLGQGQPFLNLRQSLTGLQQYGPALNIALAAGRGSLPLGVTRGVAGSLFTDSSFTLGGQQRLGSATAQSVLGESMLSAMSGSSSREGVIDLTQEETAPDSGSSTGQ